MGDDENANNRENVWVSTGDGEILKGVELPMGDEETHVLIWPNGAGKSCLVLTIMGTPAYTVDKWKVTFNGKDMTAFARVSEGKARDRAGF